MFKFRFLFLIVLFSAGLFAQTVPPKREFRAVWIATVERLDWPSSFTPSSQQSQYISMLNDHAATGINAAVVQVRPSCDAMYPSSIEPWSQYLTGTQGKAPNPYYDPLEFMVEETHKRGIEFHAWINPYRASQSLNSYRDPSHVSLQHPDWVITYGTKRYLNPGLPEVRNYVLSVIMDIVRRYDIDGIHFDDYFYPYPVSGQTFADDAAFAQDPRGFTNKDDWRRDNVNLLISMIYDSLQAVKPWIKFGISPFGIWKSGIPAGISGLSAYDAIYCDAVTWLQRGDIDYIAPQLYWRIANGAAGSGGAAQDYKKLMPWWSTQTNGRHLYTGNATYRMGGADNWPAQELVDQFTENRINNRAQGNIQFRSAHLTTNLKGFRDLLRNDLYKYPALPPVMDWKDNTPPQPVVDLNASVNSSGVTITWQKPTAASDGDSAYYYVVYRFDNQTTVNIDDPRNIKKIDYSGTYTFTENNVITGSTATATYVVTSVDRLHNESAVSAITVDANGVVPVELSSFTAALNKSKVELNWVTGTETNNYGFELERKSGIDWRTIGFVEGKGTSSEKNYYSFTDDLSSFNKNERISYRIKQIDYDGSFEYSFIVNIDYSPVPADFVLGQNYPNPFNPSTTIQYSVPEASHVQIAVYDALGNEAAVLVNEQKQPGTYELNFNGEVLSSGIYIYRLKANGTVISRKMILMK